MELPDDFWPLYIWIPLGVNLFTTLIGIVITVFYVDKAIQKNEAKQWDPTKKFVYLDLLALTETTLLSIFPAEINIYRRDRLVYKFKNNSIELHMDYPLDCLDEYTPSETILSLVKERRKTSDINIYDVRKLNTIIKRSEIIYTQSAFLMEPELLTAFMQLKAAAGYFLDMMRFHEYETFSDIVNTDFRWFDIYIIEMVKTSYTIRRLLEAKADHVKRKLYII